MAYARRNSGIKPFGYKRERSDVYVFGSISGVLECCACRLRPEGDWFGFFYTKSRSEMVKHLQEHRQIGHKVPWSATRRLKREIRQIGDDF
jgi:hypothetical protein